MFAVLRGLGFRRGPQRIAGGIGGGLAEAFGLDVWVVHAVVRLPRSALVTSPLTVP